MGEKTTAQIIEHPAFTARLAEEVSQTRWIFDAIVAKRGFAGWATMSSLCLFAIAIYATGTRLEPTEPWLQLAAMPTWHGRMARRYRGAILFREIDKRDQQGKARSHRMEGI